MPAAHVLALPSANEERLSAHTHSSHTIICSCTAYLEHGRPGQGVKLPRGATLASAMQSCKSF
eukprot:1516779-Amphidinium_carterae.1